MKCLLVLVLLPALYRQIKAWRLEIYLRKLERHNAHLTSIMELVCEYKSCLINKTQMPQRLERTQQVMKHKRAGAFPAEPWYKVQNGPLNGQSSREMI